MDPYQSSIPISVDGPGDVLGPVGALGDLGPTGADSTYTYDFGCMDSNIAWPTINVSSTSGMLHPNIAVPTITIDDTIWSNGWANPSASGTIKLTGDDADIDINGVSLMDTIRGIQDRLNMLCPDAEMEAEWDELREIRAQYEAKLQECREKSRAWRALQQSG